MSTFVSSRIAAASDLLSAILRLCSDLAWVLVSRESRSCSRRLLMMKSVYSNVCFIDYYKYSVFRNERKSVITLVWAHNLRRYIN